MENKKLNIFWISLLLLLLLFVYFVPKEIAYPSQKSLSWIVFALIFIALPFLVNKAMKPFSQSFSSSKIIGICALTILIVGPTSALFQKYRENKELAQNGNPVEGHVLDRKKSKSDWLINCVYFVNGKEFTTYYHTDKKNQYQVGNKIRIIYNKEFPRMYRIEF